MHDQASCHWNTINIVINYIKQDYKKTLVLLVLMVGQYILVYMSSFGPEQDSLISRPLCTLGPTVVVSWYYSTIHSTYIGGTCDTQRYIHNNTAREKNFFLGVCARFFEFFWKSAVNHFLLPLLMKTCSSLYEKTIENRINIVSIIMPNKP